MNLDGEDRGDKSFIVCVKIKGEYSLEISTPHFYDLSIVYLHQHIAWALFDASH